MDQDHCRVCGVEGKQSRTCKTCPDCLIQYHDAHMCRPNNTSAVLPSSQSRAANTAAAAPTTARVRCGICGAANRNRRTCKICRDCGNNYHRDPDCKRCLTCGESCHDVLTCGSCQQRNEKDANSTPETAAVPAPLPPVSGTSATRLGTTPTNVAAAPAAPGREVRVVHCGICGAANKNRRTCKFCHACEKYYHGLTCGSCQQRNEKDANSTHEPATAVPAAPPSSVSGTSPNNVAAAPAAPERAVRVVHCGICGAAGRNRRTCKICPVCMDNYHDSHKCVNDATSVAEEARVCDEAEPHEAPRDSFESNREEFVEALLPSYPKSRNPDALKRRLEDFVFQSRKSHATAEKATILLQLEAELSEKGQAALSDRLTYVNRLLSLRREDLPPLKTRNDAPSTTSDHLTDDGSVASQVEGMLADTGNISSLLKDKDKFAELRKIGGAAVKMLLDELEFALALADANEPDVPLVTCMFHPMCQLKCASVNQTIDDFIAHVKKVHFEDGPLALAFEIDHYSDELRRFAPMSAVSPIELLMYQLEQFKDLSKCSSYFCPLCFEHCGTFEQAMIHVSERHMGEGKANVISSTVWDYLKKTQIESSVPTNADLVQLWHPADRLKQRLKHDPSLNQANDVLLQCPVCGVGCESKQTLEDHVTENHPALLDSSETARTKGEFFARDCTQHSSAYQECPMCRIIFSSADFAQHIAATEDRLMKCPECAEMFDVAHVLIEHLKGFHRNDEYEPSTIPLIAYMNTHWPDDSADQNDSGKFCTWDPHTQDFATGSNPEDSEEDDGSFDENRVKFRIVVDRPKKYMSFLSTEHTLTGALVTLHGGGDRLDCRKKTNRNGIVAFRSDEVEELLANAKLEVKKKKFLHVRVFDRVVGTFDGELCRNLQPDPKPNSWTSAQISSVSPITQQHAKLWRVPLVLKHFERPSSDEGTPIVAVGVIDSGIDVNHPALRHWLDNDHCIGIVPSLSAEDCAHETVCKAVEGLLNFEVAKSALELDMQKIVDAAKKDVRFFVRRATKLSYFSVEVVDGMNAVVDVIGEKWAELAATQRQATSILNANKFCAILLSNATTFKDTFPKSLFKNLGIAEGPPFHWNWSRPPSLAGVASPERACLEALQQLCMRAFAAAKESALLAEKLKSYSEMECWTPGKSRDHGTQSAGLVLVGASAAAKSARATPTHRIFLRPYNSCNMSWGNHRTRGLIMRHHIAEAEIANNVRIAAETCDVICIACAFPKNWTDLEAAIKYAIDLKRIVVATAANKPTPSGQNALAFPACENNVIPVGALEYFSDNASAPWHRYEVMDCTYTDPTQSLAMYFANGSHTISTSLRASTSHVENLFEFSVRTGTSVAAPQIAGAIAALLCRASDAGRASLVTHACSGIIPNEYLRSLPNNNQTIKGLQATT